MKFDPCVAVHRQREVIWTLSFNPVCQSSSVRMG